MVHSPMLEAVEADLVKSFADINRKTFDIK